MSKGGFNPQRGSQRQRRESSLKTTSRPLLARVTFITVVCYFLISFLSVSLFLDGEMLRFAEAFDKKYPKARPSEEGGKDLRLTTEQSRRPPGTYSAEELEAAMPDYNDPIDGPQLECTACLSVSDIVAGRFSKLKTEFRLNMERLKPYHVDAILDDLCSKEQRFVGLLMPNVSNHLGRRVDTTFRAERMEKEDLILEEAKKRKSSLQKGKRKPSPSSQQTTGKKKQDSKSNGDEKRPKRHAREDIDVFNDKEEREWKRAGLDDFAIARRKRLRLNYTIWPEYADEREIRRKLKGGVPEDVSVLRSVKIHTEWQRFCSEAMSRMEDFGVLKVFRGSKSFNLCPMCKKDDPLAQGRSHNPGGAGSASEEETAIGSSELSKKAKQEKERKKREIAEKLKSKVIDAGDDDEDEKFIRGSRDDEYEL